MNNSGNFSAILNELEAIDEDFAKVKGIVKRYLSGTSRLSAKDQTVQLTEEVSKRDEELSRIEQVLSIFNGRSCLFVYSVYSILSSVFSAMYMYIIYAWFGGSAPSDSAANFSFTCCFGWKLCESVGLFTVYRSNCVLTEYCALCSISFHPQFQTRSALTLLYSKELPIRSSLAKRRTTCMRHGKRCFILV